MSATAGRADSRSRIRRRPQTTGPTAQRRGKPMCRSVSRKKRSLIAHQRPRGCNANFVTDRGGLLRHDDLRVGVSVYRRCESFARVLVRTEMRQHKASSRSPSRSAHPIYLAWLAVPRKNASPVPTRLVVASCRVRVAWRLGNSSCR
jgi:hypothetical protein